MRLSKAPSARRSRSAASGVVAVEFAIMLMPMLILVMGTIDWGYFFYLDQVVTNAAREGARAGSVVIAGDDATAESDADKMTKAYLTSAGLMATPTISAVASAVGAKCQGADISTAHVCVRVEYPAGSVTGMFSTILPAKAVATAVMRWQ